MTDPLDLELISWIEETIRGEVTGARRTYGGGTRVTWFVDAVRNGEALPLVVRAEMGDSAFATGPLTLDREAALYRALAPTAVRVPTLHGEEPSGRALLLDRLAGSADLRRLPPDQATTVLDDYIDQLVQLHGLAVDDLELPGLPRPTTAEDHALCDLALWASIGGEAAANDPEIAFAFAWLRSHAPSEVQRTSLVHGDAGPGNFLAEDGRVTGLIDWEFAHIGDPLDDLAWLEFRSSGRFEQTLPDVARLFERYASGSGLRLTPASLSYYRAFVYLRCSITTALTINNGGNVGLAGYQSYHRRFLRSLVEAIADVEGVDRPPSPVDAVPTERTTLYDRALRHLVDGVLPAVDSTATKVQVNEAVILLRHLRAVDQMGPALREAELADLAALLEPGASSSTVSTVVEIAREAGTTGDSDVLAYLLRRAVREEALWADAFA
jgi:aminoglycoside phosphotransferase (APT) family kinase protein